MRAERTVVASSHSPLEVTASGAASPHRPQAVQVPASKIRTSLRRASAALGQIATMRSATSRVSWLGRNAGGVGSAAAEPSGLAG
jgi:hypothetical protein